MWLVRRVRELRGSRGYRPGKGRWGLGLKVFVPCGERGGMTRDIHAPRSRARNNPKEQGTQKPSLMRVSPSVASGPQGVLIPRGQVSAAHVMVMSALEDLYPGIDRS